MRVTQNTNFNLVESNINRSRGRMAKDQEKMATMRKLNTPSDDPVGAAKVLEVRTTGMTNKQFTKNAQLAQAYLNNTDHALSGVSEIIMRAKELAIGQASGASSTGDSRLGVAEEVTQLFQQAVGLANTRVGDRFLFSGYQTRTPPYAGDGKYQGDEGKIMVEIANDVYITTNLSGVEAFNTSPNSSADLRNSGGSEETEKRRELAMNPEIPHAVNVNVFDELQSLRISLLTGDIEGIRATLDRFDQLQGKLIASRAKVGSRIAGLESTIGTLEQANITNAQLTTEIEDADMVEVMNDLAKNETVYHSVLSSSKRLVQPTLLDFLK